jgi:hypothetical protein
MPELFQVIDDEADYVLVIEEQKRRRPNSPGTSKRQHFQRANQKRRRKDFEWYAPPQSRPQQKVDPPSHEEGSLRGGHQTDEDSKRFAWTAAITEPRVEPPRPEGWKPLTLAPQLIQLSEEGIRKLADERMKEWSKDQEEHAEKQFREVQKRKAVSCCSEVTRKVPIPSVQEIEKEAEIERAEGVITGKESRERGAVAPGTDGKLDHPLSKESRTSVVVAPGTDSLKAQEREKEEAERQRRREKHRRGAEIEAENYRRSVAEMDALQKAREEKLREQNRLRKEFDKRRAELVGREAKIEEEIQRRRTESPPWKASKPMEAYAALDAFKKEELSKLKRDTEEFNSQVIEFNRKILSGD